MLCPHCQADNPNEAKFCLNCGKSLSLTCHNCGHLNKPEAKFCINCGHQVTEHTHLDSVSDSAIRQRPKEYVQKLEAARKSQSMQGERRIVTVMFCDVKGSTAMAEKLDPEEWTEIMNQAFEFLITPIYKYEGTLARLMGDGILAFFGAPIAHEDDAHRAVLAGLDIINEIQPFREKITLQYNLDFDIRVGINTGLVVVGEVGSDLFMEYTAQGDAINIASRMEQTARPGTIQIAGDTYDRVTPFFEFEKLNGVEVKGISNPVEVYQVLRPKETPARRRGIKGLESPLIGRKGEFDKLKQILQELEKGKGQIVSLIGEAGLGKSRLIREVRAVWESTKIGGKLFGNLPTRWNQVSGVSYETSNPYGVIQSLIRNFIGVTNTDTPDHIRKKLTGTLEAVQIGTAPETLSVFKTLLGIKEQTNGNQLEGEELKQFLYEKLLSTLDILIKQGPTVFVIDDLHWSDPASAEFLIHLFQLADRLPILFICAYRPERDSSAWTVKQAAEAGYAHRYIEIELSPLSDNDSDKLVNSLLSMSDLPDDLREFILKKTDGNPFFVEEVIRTLIDNGVIALDSDDNHWRTTAEVKDISIPDNLQALLAARIDRLEENAKRVLQLASVIGRSFYHPVLEIINDATDQLDFELNNLQRLDLILEAAREPFLEYIFRHALTQETAYNTILLKHRREFHRRIGEALLQLYPDRVEDFAPALGHHFYHAGDPRALKFFTIEGDSALRLYANQEAIIFYSQAIEAGMWIEKPDIEQLIHLYTNRGRAYELNSEFETALENYKAMEDIGEKLNSPELTLCGLVLQAQTLSLPSNMFNPEQGEKLVNRAMKLAEKQEDKEAQAKLYWILSNIYRFGYDSERALIAGNKSVDLARDLDNEEFLAYALNDNSHNYSMNGDVVKAIELIHEASALWRKFNNKAMLADSLSGLAASSMYTGEFEDALRYSDEAYNISLSINNIWGKAYSKYAIGIVYWDQGNTDKALEVVEQSLNDSIQANFYAGQTLTRVNLSLIYHSLGLFEESTEVLTLPDDDSLNPMAMSESFFGSFRILAYVASGKLSAAEELLEQRLKETDHLNSWNKYYEEYAKAHLLVAKGDYEIAIEEITNLTEFLEERGFVFLNHELKYLLAHSYLNIGEEKFARDALEDALKRAEKMGSRRMMWRIHFELSKLDSKQGKNSQAKKRLDQAQEYLNYIIDHITPVEMKNSFMALPDVRQALEKESISQGE